MRRTSIAVLLLVAAPVASALAVAGQLGPTRPARLDAWQVIGPGGGGTMRRPAISPHDPKRRRPRLRHDRRVPHSRRRRVVADGQLRLGADGLRLRPVPNRATVYAGAEAVYRSDDSGRTWRMVLPDPAKNTVARSIGDHGDRVLFTDDPAYPGSGRSVTIHAIAVDEDDPARVYVAASAADSPVPGTPASPTLLLGSTDGGRTWSRLAAFGPERIFALRSDGGGKAPRVRADRRERHVRRPAVHPGAHAGSRRRPLHLGELRPRPAIGPRASPTPPCRSSPGSGGLVGGVQVSEDGGRTWRAAERLAARRRPRGRSRRELGTGEGLPAVARADRRRPLASRSSPTWGCGESSFPAAATPRSTGSRRRRTADARGASSTPSPTSRRRTSAPSWIEARAAEDGHSVWFDSPYDLAVAPNDPDVAYATDLFRTYRTLDGGRAWAQVNSERRGRRIAGRREASTSRPPTASSSTPTTRSASSSPTRTSASSGARTGARRGPARRPASRRPWRNTTYWLAFDPEVKDLVWGGFSGTHDLPRPKMWRRTDPARFRGGVAVSTDGGRRWTVSNAGMEESAITHILLDPRSPKGSRTLYAAAFGRGVYKSTDNGRTWALEEQRASPPTRGTSPSRGGSPSLLDGTLYLVVARRSERGRIGDRDDGALYRSTDGAETWQPSAAARRGRTARTASPWTRPTRSGSTSRPGA